MQIFPDEHKPYIRPYHVWTVRLSGFLILAGLAGIALLTLAPSGYVDGPVRKILGGMIVFGIPVGFILLTLTISYVSYRYNKQRREFLGSKELSSSSIGQRANSLQTIAHLRYDYRSASKNWLKSTALLIAPFAVIGTLLIIYDPQPAHAIFIGILFLLGPLCSLGLGWLMLIKPKKSDYIELAVDGIHYETNGSKAFLPWSKVKEIQNMRGSYAITSEDDRLVIWSDIEPSVTPSESFFAGLFREGPYVRELVQSIKTLAPHIYQKESFLARDIKLPLSNRALVVFLVVVVLMLLFFIVIIREATNI